MVWKMSARRRLKRRLRKQMRKHGWNIHHRRPKSRGGGGGKNLVKVPKPLHVLWHEMFGNMTTDEVAYALRDVWLEGGYQVIIRRPGE